MSQGLAVWTIAAIILTDVVDEPHTLTATCPAALDEAPTTRAALIAWRAGIKRIHFAGTVAPGPRSLPRLAPDLREVTSAQERGRPFLDAPATDIVVVLPSEIPIEPKVLAALITQSEPRSHGAILFIGSHADTSTRDVVMTKGRLTSVHVDAARTVAVLTSDAVSMVRDTWSVAQAYRRLARFGLLDAVHASGRAGAAPL